MAARRATPTRSIARPAAPALARPPPSRPTSCAVSLGTETDGSILCPASVNGVVGIKPTVGLTSRAGVIPIAHSQDTVGPFGRTVADAAIRAGARIAGADPRDPATAGAALARCADRLRRSTRRRRAAWRAHRHAARGLLWLQPRDRRRSPRRRSRRCARCGAVIVDPANIPNAKEMQRLRG